MMMEDGLPGHEAFLSGIDIFRSLTGEQLERLTASQTIKELEPGEVLFAQGDPADAVYVVADGELDVVLVGHDGSPIPVSVAGKGQVLGEMQLFFDNYRTATVTARGPVSLIRLPKEIFKAFAEKHPETMDTIAGIIRQRHHNDLLATVLRDLFGPVDEKVFREITACAEWLSLPMGSRLFSQGDPSDSVYIIISGSLQALDETPGKWGPAVLNEMTRGDCIGEMGLISGEKRSSTVVASRDSLLVRFSEALFDDVLSRYPQVSRYITRVLIQRLKTQSSGHGTKKHLRNIAVVPIGRPVPEGKFAEALASALSAYGEVLHLSRDRVDELLCFPGISSVPEDSSHSLKLSAWLDEQACHYETVLYEADPDASPWTRRCIMNADQVVLVAQSGSDPALSETESLFLCRECAITSVRQILVLVHPVPLKRISGTSAWFAGRSPDQHHHVCPEASSDMARLGRFLRDRAIGVVLGGGGARGFAHIGILMALAEAGIPVDMIGGTSMGSIVAAQYAMGWDFDAILSINRNAWIKAKPLSDYTLPVYSIIRGRRINRISKDTFGDQMIEDLPINYFCVSSNLTRAAAQVHTRGFLWKGVRASSSLPGILQPWIQEAELLVDGGIINNLPGDVMRRFCDGFLILSDVGSSEAVIHESTHIPSPWRALWQKLFPFIPREESPNLFDVLVRSTLLASARKTEQVRKDADLYLKPPVTEFGLLEFKAMQQIVDRGYDYAREILESLRGDERLAGIFRDRQE